MGAALDIATDVQHWFGALLESVRNARRGFGNEPARNVRQLPQTRILRLIESAAKLYWGLDPATQRAAVVSYWEALCALKLGSDDVFVETLAASRQKAIATSLSSARIEYFKTADAFVRANPFLFTPASNRTKPLYRKPKAAPIGLDTAANVGLIQEQAVERLSVGGTDTIWTDAVNSAKQIAAELRARRSAKAAELRLDLRGFGVVGALFLVLQMYLSELGDEGGPPTFPGSDWYALARRAVGDLRVHALGIHAALVREALDAGDPPRVAALVAARKLDLERLARLFTLRTEQTAALWAYRMRRLASRSDPFGGTRLLVGANGQREKLSSYLGRPNPDGGGLDVRDVSQLLASGSTLVGTKVKVVGTLSATQRKLEDISTRSAIELKISRGLLLHGRANKIAVQADGELEHVGRTLRIDVDRLVSFADSYSSPVGFPIKVVPEAKGLDLQPAWRSETPALLAEAAEEDRATDKVATTITGQDELLNELLQISAVRKLFGRAAAARHTALHDHVFRGKVWSALFQKLHADDPKGAVDQLLRFIQRHLKSFTRHTFWNVRDSGVPYFETRFPVSITDRALYDCGVYAVTVALDLYRAIAGVPNVAMRFGFLTLLNHITLVGYHEQRSFFVNNDLVWGPVAMPKAAEQDADARAEYAMRTWGRIAFAQVYGVKYSVALVRVPTFTLTTKMDEATFKTVLWTAYKRYAVWWGLKVGVPGDFHDDIRNYDARMRDLGARVSALPKGAKASSNEVLVASTLAQGLYNLANDIARPARYGTRGGLDDNVAAVSSMGVVYPPGEPVPLYQFVALLVAAKNRGDTLTPEQQTLTLKPANPADHGSALNKVAP